MRAEFTIAETNRRISNKVKGIKKKKIFIFKRNNERSEREKGSLCDFFYPPLILNSFLFTQVNDIHNNETGAFVYF